MRRDKEHFPGGPANGRATSRDMGGVRCWEVARVSALTVTAQLSTDPAELLI